jgi:hypothetical protein
MKPYQSKTIIGAVITLLATITPLFVPITEEEVGSVAQIIIQLIGVGMTIYGRIVATKEIKL